MTKLDKSLTIAVQDWLNTPEASRDIPAGAELLLKITRNRALYNSVIRKPEKFAAKLAYELRKHLRIRLDNLAVSDLIKVEELVIPKIQETVKTLPPISTDDEIVASPKGRRPDHDSLPAEIRELWDSNGARARQIVILFNELKNMRDAQPCDRYEKVKALGELDAKYRDNMARYDAYKAPAAADDEAPATDLTAEPAQDRTPEQEKMLNSARKTLSKYRKILADQEATAERKEQATMKILRSYNVIRDCGSDISESTKSDLRSAGIEI